MASRRAQAVRRGAAQAGARRLSRLRPAPCRLAAAGRRRRTAAGGAADRGRGGGTWALVSTSGMRILASLATPPPPATTALYPRLAIPRVATCRMRFVWHHSKSNRHQSNPVWRIVVCHSLFHRTHTEGTSRLARSSLLSPQILCEISQITHLRKKGLDRDQGKSRLGRAFGMWASISLCAASMGTQA